VSIILSEMAADAMLDVLGSLMDGGTIELLADSGKTLAVMRLSATAADVAAGGELVFNKIAEEDAALAQGDVSSARIVGADGGIVFQCSVGDENSSAVIKLNTTRIYRNGPVRLHSFRLLMPTGG
jgi:hypothetical protein